MNNIPPLTEENQREKARLVREWSAKARKGNYWWYKVAEMIHIEGDYIETDYGDPEAGLETNEK